jgi:phosphoglycolate phosphatase-like HAD superfamily hydrolase
VAYLQFAGGNLRISLDKLREQRNISKFAKEVAGAGGGLDGAHQALPKENRHLLICDGDVIKTNIVARIFEELYLGADSFERVYGQPAIIIQSTGYAEHEALIISPEVLTKLQQKLALGVVSDRPRHEVLRSLKAQKIDSFFQAVVTLDEIRQAKANPIPDPWCLLEAARYLQPTPTHTGYVGANVGDIQAAKAANQTVPFSAIGCVIDAPDRRALSAAFEDNKVDIILGHPNNLKELLLG